MDTLALVLVIIGAFNWGLIGFFGFDLVASLFGGATTTMARATYALVGLGGLWALTFLFRGNTVTGRNRKARE